MRNPVGLTGIALLALAMGVAACGRKSAAGTSAPPDAAAVRAARENFLRTDPSSPFHTPAEIPFSPLKYYPISAEWVFRSKLERLARPETVTILDTKGESREGGVIGLLRFRKDGRDHVLRVYRMLGPVRGVYTHSIWFTDDTTGKETYPVGRYLNFTPDEDRDHVYTIDFNQAYNPHCAYAPAYACPIPRPEDRLALAVTAGERNWP